MVIGGAVSNLFHQRGASDVDIAFVVSEGHYIPKIYPNGKHPNFVQMDGEDGDTLPRAGNPGIQGYYIPVGTLGTQAATGNPGIQSY